VAAAFAAGCTGVDDSLGEGMIPSGQRIELKTATVTAPFDGYLQVNDTVPASGEGVLFLGSMEDEVFGRLEGTAMTDFYPLTTDWNEGQFFGDNPTIDSVYMRLSVSRIGGKRDVAQTINVYALRDSIKRDSTYRMGTPNLLEKVDLDKPLFSFELKGYPSNDGVKLNPTEDGLAFLQQLADVPDEVYANPWPDFHKQFYGFYFAPAADAPADAGFYEISINSGASGFSIFFHNETEDPEKPDNAYVVYDFRSTNWVAPTVRRAVNVHVNSLKHTYPAAIENNLQPAAWHPADIGAAAPQDVVYAQSLGGVIACLHAKDALSQWLEDAKEGYSDMVIHSVQVDIPVAQLPLNRELLPMRMGMYYRYATGWNIPDSNHTLENTNSSKGMTIPYGGYYHIANGGYYRMDVTQWLTDFMLDPTETPDYIWLGPEINSRANRLTQGAVDTRGIKLEVIYTLIR
jgi:hypothetical protein